MHSVIIAGSGYVGSKLVSQLLATGENVITLVKSHSSCERLSGLTTCYSIDLDGAFTLPASVEFDHSVLYYFIPPQNSGVRDERLRVFLKALENRFLPDKIILISTTGVYGNCNGDWVDESRPVSPDTDRAKRRLDAEQVLSSWCESRNVGYIIMRVPGIYGADKLPLDRLISGKPILALDESPWSNRIHVDDLVSISIEFKSYVGSHHIFNISDGSPSTMSDFFIKVAQSRNIEIPPQISLAQCSEIFSENMMSYLLESKRIDNQRLLSELQYDLKYPSIKEGLSANRD